jgi:hypothetical protein
MSTTLQQQPAKQKEKSTQQLREKRTVHRNSTNAETTAQKEEEYTQKQHHSAATTVTQTEEKSAHKNSNNAGTSNPDKREERTQKQQQRWNNSNPDRREECTQEQQQQAQCHAFRGYTLHTKKAITLEQQQPRQKRRVHTTSTVPCLPSLHAAQCSAAHCANRCATALLRFAFCR